MKESNLVVVSEYNTPMEAELAKTVLGSAGIYTEIENEIMSSIYPTGIIPSKLLVREEDAEQAERLLFQR